MGSLNPLDPSDVVDIVGDPSGGKVESGESGGDENAGDVMGLYSPPSSSLAPTLSENERRLFMSLKFNSGDPL
jgi:hypothetical protein